MSPPLVSKQLQVVQTCASQSSQYHVVWRFDVPPTSNYMQRTPKQPWFVLSVFVISPVSSLRSISIWYRMIIMYNEVMNPLQHIALHYQNLHYPSLGGSWNIDSCPAMFNSELRATLTGWQRHNECSSIASTWSMEDSSSFKQIQNPMLHLGKLNKTLYLQRVFHEIIKCRVCALIGCDAHEVYDAVAKCCQFIGKHTHNAFICWNILDVAWM